ncbi:MFS transporter [Rhodococcus ruber]|uniref:MFS transporter n=1 Tax=Rhodococcus ruber TaxID=1830 RepID=UPI0013C52C1F|nr:MFS transporter [Rhodococcus ruber]
MLTMGSESRLATTPLNRRIVLICMGLYLLDGYDIFVMGYALPHLPDGFATPAQKGYLISAALVGMGIGGAFLGRFADVYGRRPVLIVAIVLNTVGLLASALAPTYLVLIASRGLTGIAVGAIAIVSVVICQEMTPRSLQSLSIGIVMFGYPLGTFIAGLGGSAVIGVSGSWQGLFWLGVALSTLALIAAVRLIPETVPFLRRSPDRECQRRATEMAARLELDEDPRANANVADGSDSAKDANVKLLGRDFRRVTLLLWAGFPLIAGVFFFIGTWTPQLITNATGDAGTAALVGMAISIGMMVGSLVYGFFGLRYVSMQLSWAGVIVAMVAIVGFVVFLQGTLAVVLAFVLGMGVYVVQSSYVALASSVYPVQARAKGYGLMGAVGRVGAVGAPILAGYAVSFWDTQYLYLAVLLPLALVGLCSLALFRATRPATAPQPAKNVATNQT